jgi:hypothetical protein
MSSELRVWTQNTFEVLRAARWNTLQDQQRVAGTLSQWSPVNTAYYGALNFYGQFALTATTQHDISSYFDWRDRMIHLWWTAAYISTAPATSILPSDANYTAQLTDIANTAPDIWQHLWYTDTGDNVAGLGTHIDLDYDPISAASSGNDGATVSLYAGDGGVGTVAGDLYLYNGNGTARYVVLWGLAFPTHS